MSRMRKTGYKSQRGASIYSMIMLGALMGLVLIAVLRLVPPYLDNNVIINAMEGIIANNDMSEISITQIRTDVIRSINVNGMRNFDPSNIQLTMENGREYVDINYESRVDIFYNIDAIVSFENRFEK